jgi:hypothetical protein
LNPSTSAAILGFLNAENGFSRAESAFFSASLELDTALRARKEQSEEFYAALARSNEFVKQEDVDGAEASLAESAAFLRAGPRLEAAKAVAASISSFRSAAELLISNEKSLASEMSAAGMPFRAVFGPYYQRSINKANEAEKHAKPS